MHLIKCRSIQNFITKRFLSEPPYKKDAFVNFGYKMMDEKQKFDNVNKVFSNVASKYDLMNDYMSLGIHRIWKNIFVDELFPVEGGSYLDVAGGTGDIAFRIYDYIQKRTKPILNPHLLNRESKNDLSDHSSTLISIVDINNQMLEYGKDKCNQIYGLNSETQACFNWHCMDAENLGFDDNSFDAYTISFGIRNCVHPQRVLHEAYRVLKPGGRFLCLEFGKVSFPPLAKLYKFYSFNIIPVLGHLIAGDWESYQYLVESIEKFPSQPEFRNMIEQARFDCVTQRELSGGIAVISSGFKI